MWQLNQVYQFRRVRSCCQFSIVVCDTCNGNRTQRADDCASGTPVSHILPTQHALLLHIPQAYTIFDGCLQACGFCGCMQGAERPVLSYIECQSITVRIDQHERHQFAKLAFTADFITIYLSSCVSGTLLCCVFSQAVMQQYIVSQHCSRSLSASAAAATP